jgi:ribokinase
MASVAVLGSFNMDLVMRASRQPRPGETLQGEFAMHLGGKGFNQAVAARRLRADVRIVGRVGDDEFGRRFLATLDDEGVDRRAVAIDADAGTGVASIVVDSDGENAIVQAPQANRSLNSDDIERFDWPGSGVAMLQLETSMAAAIAFARKARSAGMTTLLNPAPAGAVPDELIELADVIVPNLIEARAITGIEAQGVAAAFSMAGQLCRQGPRTCVVTLGADGAVVVDAQRQFHLPAFAVRAVDTVGAGDAFCAGLAVALAEGRDFDEAVSFACAAGALATTRHGAEPSLPYRRDVESLLQGGVVT